MDTDTMLEVFKYFNYRQLAYNSLVSKIFWNLIRTKRHSLALLCVYDICNNGKLSAYIRAIGTNIELNHEDLDRLLTDPLIYICSIHLISRNDTLNLLAAAIGRDRRLRCKEFNLTPDYEDFTLNGFQDFIEWINGHVCCDEFILEEYVDQSHDQALLNFFVTGAQCTSSITVLHSDWYEDLFEVYVDFVQEFMDHKECDEFQFVDSIKSNLIGEGRIINELEIRYPKCIVKKETDEDDGSTTYVFEFNNNDIGKKLLLTVIHDNESWYRLLIKIEDL